MEQKRLTLYWKRNSETESVPRLAAFRKENDVRDYLGTPVKGGQKFIIPDIEENQELVECMGGQWSTKSPAKEEVEEEVTEPKKAKK